MRIINKVILLALAMALLVAAKHAQALFSVEVSIKNNVLRSGTLSVVAQPGEALLTANAMTSGSSVSNVLSLENNGTIPAKLTISATKSAGYTTYFNALNLKITSNGKTLYEGPVSKLQSIPLTEQALGVSQKADFQFTTSLPTETTNALSNSYANITWVITATESS